MFVAVMTNTRTNETVSEVFAVTSHGESPSHRVLTKLVGRFFGKPVSRAEHGPCALEFLIQSELDEKEVDSLCIAGSDIRFRRQASQTSWETLGDHVRVQLFRSNPHVLDDDAATLATNKRIAKEALATTRCEINEEGKTHAIELMRLTVRGRAVQALEGEL